MRDTHPMQKVYIYAVKSFSSTLKTRFPFQRRCPDRLAQSYDYLCVVLAATARALRCMHALSLHRNFTHACMHCVTAVMHNRARATACTSDSRSDIRELSQLPSMPKGKLCTYRLWQLTIFFFYFSCFRLIFSGILIVWITFDHHYFWILSMEFSNNATFAEKSWFLGNFPFTCVQSACSASGALAAHVCLNVRWMGILRVATAWYACTVTARKFHSRMHCVTAVLGSYYHA